MTLDASLLEYCIGASGGSYRPLMRLFEQIERIAKTAGVRNLSLAKWQQLSSLAGVPAAPKRKGAKAAA